MKNLSILGLLVLCYYSSYGQTISGPTEVEESVTVTYVNSWEVPSAYFFWIIEEGQSSYTCQDSVNHSWDTPGFYKVELWMEFAAVDVFLSSLDVVVGDPPFIEYKYDNSGNRTSREVIYYSERRDGLKSYTKEQDNQDEELENLESINLFPNPAIYAISISVNADVLQEDNRRILMYDMQGRKIRDIQPQGNLVSIDVSDMSKGSYVVKLIYGKRVKDWILVKQ